MAACYPSARLVALAFFLFVAGSTLFAPEVVEASFFGDIGEAINVFKEVTCPSEHQTAMDVCHSLAFPFYHMQAIVEDDHRKESCCSRLAARNCMEQVTKAYCGELGQYTAAFASVLDKIITKEKCRDYESVGQCTHPALLLLLVVIIGSVLVSLLIAVLNCLCGFNKRRYHRIADPI